MTGDYTYTRRKVEFLRAQTEAEESHKQEFICPICGGAAMWARTFKNDLFTKCSVCGIELSSGGVVSVTLAESIFDFQQDFLV